MQLNEPYITLIICLLKKRKLLRGITYIMTATGVPATIILKINTKQLMSKEAPRIWITISLVKMSIQLDGRISVHKVAKD